MRNRAPLISLWIGWLKLSCVSVKTLFASLLDLICGSKIKEENVAKVWWS
jgi:hypothetical protein